MPGNLFTFSFFGGEVILKGFASPDSFEMVNGYFFLKLADGTWVKSVANVNCDFRSEKDKENSILKLIITIQTPDGFKTRTLIKKI